MKLCDNCKKPMPSGTKAIGCNPKCTRKIYKRSEVGGITLMYNTLKARAGKPKIHVLTKEAFEEWLYRSGYSSMYNAWVESGYCPNLKPITRVLRPKEDYCKENLRLSPYDYKLTKYTEYVPRHTKLAILSKEALSFLGVRIYDTI